MLKGILQVPIFVLIAFSYSNTLSLLSKLPSLFIGMSLGIIRRVRKRSFSAGFLSVYTRIESATTILMVAVFVILFLRFHWWEASWLKIWASPILIAITLVAQVKQASASLSYNPILRSQAAGARFVPWVLLALALVGFFAPSYIKPATFEYGVIAATVLAIFGNVVLLTMGAREIQSFESLDARHDKLTADLKTFQHIAFLIGDAENWRTVREAIENVENQHTRTLTALRNKRLLEAENIMIQAESEVAHIERTFQDRIRFSLKDELAARLEQAKHELKTLQDEAEIGGLSAESIKQLATQIPELLGTLNQLDPAANDLLDRLEPYEKLFREIVDTRTALRFRQNVGNVAASLPEEIETRSQVIYLARDLGVATTEAEESQTDLEGKLNAFRSDPMNNPGDLVAAYQSVQAALTNFKSDVARLESRLKFSWTTAAIEPDRITAYVPKTCATDVAARGGIAVEFGSATSKEVTVEMDGALLELQAERKLTVAPLAGKLYGVGIFTFVGKRGGRGILKISLSGSSAQVNCPVLVKPSVSEMVRDAVVYGTPIGGLVILVLWFLLKYDLKDASQVGAAIGAASGLLIFALQYFKFRKRG